MIRPLVLAWMLAWLSWLAPASADAQAAPPHQVLVFLTMPPPHFRPDANDSGGYANPAGVSARRRVAAALARSYGLRLASGWPMPLLGVDCYAMDVPEASAPAEIADRLAREPGVAWAQVMNVFRPMGQDARLFNLQPAAQQWHLAELHRTATGHGVRVAVIDSGIQADHPDLSGQADARLNLLTDSPDAAELHGTAVAGIIAARGDDRSGIVGIAPHVRLLALRACWQRSTADTLCSSLSLARALDAALRRGADVINLSLGGPVDPLIQRLIELALARGVAVVAAANRNLADGGFPAALPGVIAVADLPSDKAGGALAAPGTDILTTVPGSRWGFVSGPSYAAAHVSGLLALILDARSRIGAAGGHERALAATDLVSGLDGRIDACASLSHAAPSCDCSCSPGADVHSLARH
ncbi:S8 family serine peptidase [Caenimonas terrae]|uniref:S8 family serine peptidase n=1 Tax=Caenimonas terrae TaxID=696074 RepID=A0ABW0NI69_9BURK